MNNFDKVEIMIAQCDDMQRIIDDSIYSKIAFINFKQRQRFIACTFAKNGEQALTRLWKLENGL